MRDLRPSTQNFFFDSVNRSNYLQLFALCAFYMNGYGCEASSLKALESLKLAASAGFHSARAYMYRIFAACSVTDRGGVSRTRNLGDLVISNRNESEVPGIEYLKHYAKLGCRAAFEELRKISSDEDFGKVCNWLRIATGGVGAPWYSDSEMLHGFTLGHWFDDKWMMEQVKLSSNLSSFVVNKKGDTVLHLLAACGRWKPFKSLITDHKMDINTLNTMGETPLLCACRAGQGGIAILCLQSFKADASIAAKNGETPLHWLISFDNQYIQPLVQDLIINGARIEAITYEPVCHSTELGTIDTEFQLPGTALLWAVRLNRPEIVRILLQHGADPYAAGSSNEIVTPLSWAAFFHHDQCLRIIIEHLEEKVTRIASDGKKDKRYALMYGGVVEAAVHAADRFSMILRNGTEYINRLHATLDLLREKTKLISFQGTFHGSLLYVAVSKAHDEVVDYMFTNNWLVETINEPCGTACRTPVLEAVRWNRLSMFRLLVDHGADVHALAANPFQPHLRNWSALHIFANEGHVKNVSLVHQLIQRGVSVEGVPVIQKGSDNHEAIDTDAINVAMSSLSVRWTSTKTFPCETPFLVALRQNAFPLASTLLTLGANPNATTLSAGLFSSPHPLTVLGHTIISNARYSSARLKYLLGLEEEEEEEEGAVDFIVEPSRRLTALHRAAMANADVTRVSGEAVRREDFDFDTNAEIMYELLLKWHDGETLNAQCLIRGNTALHLAVEARNLGAISQLVRRGIDVSVVNDDGRTALELAESIIGGQDGEHAEILRVLKSS